MMCVFNNPMNFLQNVIILSFIIFHKLKCPKIDFPKHRNFPQSINQSISQSINQSINQSESSNQSGSQLIDRLINQPVNLFVNN